MKEIYTAFFTEVSERFKLLGRKEGFVNLVFIDTPEVADLLLSQLSTRITYPLLLVEFYDENQTWHGSGFRKVLTGAFAVVAPQKRAHSGLDHAREVIYEQCKPAADGILSLMVARSNAGTIDPDGAMNITLGDEFPGNWVGPLHNDLYGWRYEFTWTVPGGSCFKEADWLPIPPPEPEP
jgi:hypothetical protein